MGGTQGIYGHNEGWGESSRVEYDLGSSDLQSLPTARWFPLLGEALVQALDLLRNLHY